MALSHINGIAVSGISHLNGVAKANISAINGVTAGFGGGGFDTDAQAFFTATGISDSTIQNAIDALVVGLKADGVWSKLLAIYPMVGGTSSTHLVNLKSPGTFNITWAGAVTHNANGVTGDGSTGYGDTGFNQSTHGAEDDEHLSIYIRALGADNTSADIGVNDGSGTGSRIRSNNGGNVVAQSQSTVAGSAVAAAGYISTNRTASTGFRIRVNGTNTAVTQASDVAVINRTFTLLARNAVAGVISFSARNGAWYAIGRGLTETEDGNLRTRVETFQDALSRGVV